MSFWCFVFLSRCLIYKVHANSFSAVSALYFSTLFFACQVLFSEVFRFLLSSTLIQAHSLSSRNSFILPHSFESVKNFFQVFSRFSTSNHSISVLFQRLPLSRANLFSLPHASHFVKHFFQVPFEVHPASAWFLLTFRLVSVPSREALR